MSHDVSWFVAGYACAKALEPDPYEGLLTGKLRTTEEPSCLLGQAPNRSPIVAILGVITGGFRASPGFGREILGSLPNSPRSLVTVSTNVGKVHTQLETCFCHEVVVALVRQSTAQSTKDLSSKKQVCIVCASSSNYTISLLLVCASSIKVLFVCLFRCMPSQQGA